MVCSQDVNSKDDFDVSSGYIVTRDIQTQELELQASFSWILFLQDWQWFYRQF